VSGSREEQRYHVERVETAPGFIEVALVRHGTRNASRLGLRRPTGDHRSVLFQRRFRPLLESIALEAYAAKLEQVAVRANHGTFGCFVDIRTSGSMVQVTLYERWFDGVKLRCEELASRSFDAEDEGALIASAEFQASLEEWAQRRNEERDVVYLDASIKAAANTQRATQGQVDARELAEILRAVRSPMPEPGP
jgi:hypothetical protein